MTLQATRACPIYPGQAEKEIITAAVNSTDGLEAKKAAAAQAVASASNSAQQDVIEAAVKSIEGLGAKKAAAAQAVASAVPENRVSVAQEAVEQLTSQQQQEVASRFLPSREAVDYGS